MLLFAKRIHLAIAVPWPSPLAAQGSVHQLCHSPLQPRSVQQGLLQRIDEPRGVEAQPPKSPKAQSEREYGRTFRWD